MKRGILLGALIAAISYMGCDTKPPENGCEGTECIGQVTPPPDGGGSTENDGGTDAGDDGGTDETDGGDGEDDGGTGETDGGGGTPDAGPTEPVGPQSEWPTDEKKNFTSSYSIPKGIKSVGIDDGHNIWVLETNRVGVLTSEKKSVTWVSDIGQWAGSDLTHGATVICGGAAGKAYVGHSASDTGGERTTMTDPEYQKGDVDIVQMTADGSIELREHLWRTFPIGALKTPLGIRNTNAWRYDEDRTVLSCVKSYKGNAAGEVFIGTNHGVTRIDGDVYNSHIHPRWMENGSQRAGYTYGLGIAQDGDVLIANDWHVGRATPTADPQYWDKQGMGDEGATYGVNRTPFRFDVYVPEVNSEAEFDFWRGVAETTEQLTWNGRKARYMYLGNVRPDGWTNPYGLYRLLVTERTDKYLMEIVETEKLAFPHMVNALAATDDGSLFIGTLDDGLYRMAPDHSISKVAGVSGSTVRQIVYDPTASPSMLLVLTNDALWVLRGH